MVSPENSNRNPEVDTGSGEQQTSYTERLNNMTLGTISRAIQELGMSSMPTSEDEIKRFVEYVEGNGTNNAAPEAQTTAVSETQAAAPNGNNVLEFRQKSAGDKAKIIAKRAAFGTAAVAIGAVTMGSGNANAAASMETSTPVANVGNELNDQDVNAETAEAEEAEPVAIEYTVNGGSETITSTFEAQSSYSKENDHFYDDGKTTDNSFTAPVYDKSITDKNERTKAIFEGQVNCLMTDPGQMAVWSFVTGSNSEFTGNNAMDLNGIDAVTKDLRENPAHFQEAGNGLLEFFDDEVQGVEEFVVEPGTKYISMYQYLDEDGVKRIEVDYSVNHDYEIHATKLIGEDGVDLLNEDGGIKAKILEAHGIDVANADKYEIVWSGDCNQFILIPNGDIPEEELTTIPHRPDNPTPPSQPTPPEPEKPEDPTPPEKPEDPTPPEKPEDPTPPEKPEDPTPPEKPEDPTPPEKPEDPTPPEKPEDPTPPEKPEDPTPPEKPKNTDAEEKNAGDDVDQKNSGDPDNKLDDSQYDAYNPEDNDGGRNDGSTGGESPDAQSVDGENRNDVIDNGDTSDAGGEELHENPEEEAAEDAQHEQDEQSQNSANDEADENRENIDSDANAGDKNGNGYVDLDDLGLSGTTADEGSNFDF